MFHSLLVLYLSYITEEHFSNPALKVLFFGGWEIGLGWGMCEFSGLPGLLCDSSPVCDLPIITPQTPDK